MTKEMAGNSIFLKGNFGRLLPVLIVVLLSLPAQGQNLIPLSGEMNRRMEYQITQTKPDYFTVVKPYIQSDSLFPAFYKSPENDTKISWLKRKLFYESLVEVDSSGFYLYFDPAFDFSLGQDNTGRKTFTNTRGFNAGGRIGSKFAFGTSFYENQAIFPLWIQNGIQNKIITGQGRGRLNGSTWDYAHSGGYLSFSPIKKLNIQLGQGKNFIGDGYRSLLLSDVAYNYPYSRVSFLSEKLMYSWMLGVIQDMSIDKGNDQFTYGKRMISSHTLSVNPVNAVQVSIVKNTVYNNPDTTGKFSPGWEEFSPVMLPVSSGKSHSLWGLNLKVMVNRYLWVYAQSAFDNLIGHGAVHSSYQFGSKYFDAFGVTGLYLQAEYNRVEPQTYSSANKTLLWLHYREPLAHPYGNNISEGILNITYNWRRWQFYSILRITKQLKQDETVAPANYTGFPYLNNGTEVMYSHTEVNWFLNPKTTTHFSLGFIMNNHKAGGTSTSSNMVSLSFRTALFNNYIY